MQLVRVAEPVARCGEGAREFRGGEIAERRMRALLIVRRGPSRQRRSGVIEIVEDRLVEQFVTHPAVERLADPVLHRFSRRNEMPCDPTALNPGEHSVGGKLGSMVGDDQIRFAASGDDSVELARRPSAGD